MELAPPLDRGRLADALEALSQQRPSPAGAVLSAALLAAGVLLLDWPAAVVFGFFWLENALGGVFFLVRMLFLRGSLVGDDLAGALARDPRLTPEARQRQLQAAAGCLHVLAPFFFLFHYGVFCAVHGVFVALLFPGWADGFTTPAGMLAVAVLVGWLAHDTWRFRARQEFRALPRMVYMMSCYDRVLLLHVALLVGGFVVFLFGTRHLVLLLIVLKLIVDWRGGFSLSRHIAHHLRRQAAPAA